MDSTIEGVLATGASYRITPTTMEFRDPNGALVRSVPANQIRGVTRDGLLLKVDVAIDGGGGVLELSCVDAADADRLERIIRPAITGSRTSTAAPNQARPTKRVATAAQSAARSDRGTPDERPYNVTQRVSYRSGWLGLLSGESQGKALERAIAALNEDGYRVVFIVPDRWNPARVLLAWLLILLTLGIVSITPNLLIVGEPLPSWSSHGR